MHTCFGSLQLLQDGNAITGSSSTDIHLTEQHMCQALVLVNNAALVQHFMMPCGVTAL
jgi:hypothetical protein